MGKAWPQPTLNVCKCEHNLKRVPTFTGKHSGYETLRFNEAVQRHVALFFYTYHSITSFRSWLQLPSAKLLKASASRFPLQEIASCWCKVNTNRLKLQTIKLSFSKITIIHHCIKSILPLFISGTWTFNLSFYALKKGQGTGQWYRLITEYTDLSLFFCCKIYKKRILFCRNTE